MLTDFLTTIVTLSLLAPVSPYRTEVDRFGGFTPRTGHNTSGFFRVEKMGDRFVLVTPDNHPFISVAVTTALFKDMWGGRCPPLDSYPNPYGNQAKYNGQQAAWESALKANLERWGFNGLGCWCQQGVGELTENVRSLAITMTAERQGVRLVGRHFVDVFDTKFEEVAEQQSKSLATHADSPYRIGSFPDNEIGWVGPDVWGREGGPALPDVFIALPAEAHGKRFWAEMFCREKYGTIDALNRAYGTAFSDFTGPGNTLIQTAELPNRDGHPAIFADKCDFVEAIADRYYRVVTQAMRRHDPNHLVFSARWALWTTAFHKDFPEYQAYNERIWKKSGEYCDIIAINTYMDNPQLEAEHRLYSRVFAQTGKPIMITEWAWFADDTQYVYHPEWMRYQRDRGAFYVKQFRAFLDFEFPDPDSGEPVHPFVGAQWFQYYDEPSLGRPDGERNNYGLLNVKDEPYVTALDLMGTFNAQIYDYVFKDEPIEILAAPEPKSPLTSEAESRPAEALAETGVFSWSEVEGAASYTLLLSPEKCFPREQTLRHEPLHRTALNLQERLAPGLWYWCVRAVDARGLGGMYSRPIAFRVGPSDDRDRVAAYLAMEDLSAWRNVSLEDGGWHGVTWAFLDQEVKTEGRSSARVQFTINSLNKKTGELNQARPQVFWEYDGPPLDLDSPGAITLQVRPHRAVDAKGKATVSSKYLGLRIENETGKVLLDQRIDRNGALAPLEWTSLRLLVENSATGRVKRIALYADGQVPDIPWDQRLWIWADDVRFTRR